VAASRLWWAKPLLLLLLFMVLPLPKTHACDSACMRPDCRSLLLSPIAAPT
jgi:hypothetical protein